jgi:diguanylate cyclase (GGDEF)-like protein
VSTGKVKADPFLVISGELRTATWDIVESCLEETKIDSRENLTDLPTLVGGVAKIISDPMFLMDLEPGGDLYSAAQRLGRLHQETGVPIAELMADLSRLRRELWLFCEQTGHVRPADYYELERRLNQAVDMMTAAAVDVFHHRSTAEISAASTRDKLTGFLRGAAFRERLEKEFAKAKRYRHPLVLIRADIDDFGAFNEAGGRRMGNDLLRQVAAEIHRELRHSDEAARLGADEFGLILPETDIANGRLTAERIRQSVRRVGRGKDSPVTISMGGAAFPEKGEEWELLMNGADTALARARQYGDTVLL